MSTRTYTLVPDTTLFRAHLGLEAAEAEVEPGPGCHRPGEFVLARRAVLGQPHQLRAARVRQAHHLGGLVEGLARGVVQGLAEQPLDADRAHRDQLGVAAGDQLGVARRVGRAVYWLGVVTARGATGTW